MYRRSRELNLHFIVILNIFLNIQKVDIYSSRICIENQES
jgi:hypothetical protein